MILSRHEFKHSIFFNSEKSQMAIFLLAKCFKKGPNGNPEPNVEDEEEEAKNDQI